MQNAKRPDPKLCFVEAYCARWMGENEAAYWALYRALLPSLFPAYRNDELLTKEETVLLLRARSLVVPPAAKRHIHCKDLRRLVELDGENADVYLLARCYFHYLDTHWNGSPDEAKADLRELRALPKPGRSGESPVLWEAFPEDFLKFITRN